MQTWEAITARRDVRNFTDAALDRDQLGRILEAGRRSPSSQNWQPWGFVVVTERERPKVTATPPDAECRCLR